MSDRQHALYIVDIFIAIDKIYRYTDRFVNAQELLNSELEWDGAIRELEIIGEATNYLLKANQIDEKYRRIVDFRNQIIHGYFGIDESIVFDVIRNKLPHYYDDLLELAKYQENDVLEAIDHAKKENFMNKNVLNFLNQLVVGIQQ
jgi:uncharacterized protein with HEPN domain